MTILDADEISRVALLHLTDGTAASLEDAERLLLDRQLTLHPAPRIVTTPAGQAAILTAAVTAVRTFGVVYVELPEDIRVSDGVHRGRLLSDALREEGARLDRGRAAPNRMVLVIGSAGSDVPSTSGELTLHASWEGWTATVSPTPRLAPVDQGNVLAAIAAAALAVSEAFAHARSIPGSDAGYRTVHVNLLGPDSGSGPDLRYAPASWWLVGLGHLGQAYGWVISHLPFDSPVTVEVTLQDTDRTSPANHSTSVLTPRDSRGVPKTRLVADRLEDAGLRTRIIERALNEDFRLRADELHTVALIGVDNLPTRRALSAIGWPLTIDVGLGAQASDHTAISMHRFPGSKPSHDILAWQDQLQNERAIPATPGFADLDRRFDRCGIVSLAGKAIGVPFVGTIAACLAVSEALKELHGLPGSAVAGIDISTGHHVSAPAPRHNRIAPLSLRRE
ncbi:hypothetical protein [Microbacterium sp.]|uniref:hypothetical protein n=1 Tax=Microbacterium sp. TaxID=51671 RepID=UPI0025FE0A93|nr:hypothetical protein [Microbacterium sp.]